MSTVPGQWGHPHDDLAVYALDASTPEERERVERHVETCDACRAELDDHRRTLSLMAPEVDEEPPATAWEAIAHGVRALGNGHHATLPVPLPPRDPGDTAGAAGLRDGDDLAVRRARRRSQPRRLLLAAAAAVVVVVGVVGLLGRGGDGEGEGDVLAAARTAAEAPGAAVGTLGSGEVGGDVVARVVADGDEAYVLDDGLADLPDGRTYQVWRLDGGRATSIGLLGPDDGATAIDAQSPDARLAITEEPSGGSPAPTGPVVATGTFPA